MESDKRNNQQARDNGDKFERLAIVHLTRFFP
jgi:hypothetical protein